MSEPIKIDIILKLTPTTRDILKLMHYLPIAEEAKHLAFYEDGSIHWFDNFRPGVLTLPKMHPLVYYTDTAHFNG